MCQSCLTLRVVVEMIATTPAPAATRTVYVTDQDPSYKRLRELSSSHSPAFQYSFGRNDEDATVPYTALLTASRDDEQLREPWLGQCLVVSDVPGAATLAVRAFTSTAEAEAALAEEMRVAIKELEAIISGLNRR